MAEAASSEAEGHPSFIERLLTPEGAARLTGAKTLFSSVPILIIGIIADVAGLAGDTFRDTALYLCIGCFALAAILAVPIIRRDRVCASVAAPFVFVAALAVVSFTVWGVQQAYAGGGSALHKRFPDATEPIIALLRGQEELKEGQTALREGQNDLREGQEGLREGQDGLREGQEGLREGQDGLREGQAEVRREVGQLSDDVTALVARSEATARQLGLQEGLLVALARNYASDAQDFDSALRAIENALKVAAEERKRPSQPADAGEATDAVLGRMATLNDAGDLDAAQAALADELRAMEAEDARRRTARKRLYESGVAQATLRNEPADAARYLLLAAEVERPIAFATLGALWDEWYVRGRDKGLNFDLAVSEALARVAVERAASADEKGAAANYLGMALETLGGRERGTARLEASVAAFRTALTHYARERTPLPWATTQNNLADALQVLGVREASSARLEEAVVAYRAALEENTRERAPLDWARAQNNLANTLQTLGLSEAGTARLEEAVAAYRAALTEATRERAPLEWAAAQNNLANTLQALGERETGTERLEEAIPAFRAALEEMTRERMPLNWATAQYNLANTLQKLGERADDAARLREALVAFRAALEEFTRERVPLNWAAARSGLGLTLALIAKRDGDREGARAAVAMLEEAVPVLEEGGHQTFAFHAGIALARARTIASELEG